MRLMTFMITLFMVNHAWAGCYDETLNFEQNFINCKAAAEKGDSDSQYFLGNMYNSEQNEALAVYWYQHAADQNNDLAQYSLAVMYEYGRGGLSQSQQEADKWYQLAAENGNYFAQNKLGLITQKTSEHQTTITPYHDESFESNTRHQNEYDVIENVYDWILQKLN